jgi:hypothetical protein
MADDKKLLGICIKQESRYSIRYNAADLGYCVEFQKEANLWQREMVDIGCCTIAKPRLAHPYPHMTLRLAAEKYYHTLWTLATRQNGDANRVD